MRACALVVRHTEQANYQRSSRDSSSRHTSSTILVRTRALVPPAPRMLRACVLCIIINTHLCDRPHAPHARRVCDIDLVRIWSFAFWPHLLSFGLAVLVVVCVIACVTYDWRYILFPESRLPPRIFVALMCSCSRVFCTRVCTY